jgi:hypothetical protein
LLAVFLLLAVVATDDVDIGSRVVYVHYVVHDIQVLLLVERRVVVFLRLSLLRVINVSLRVSELAFVRSQRVKTFCAWWDWLACCK